jgi:hypothetical protein
MEDLKLTVPGSAGSAVITWLEKMISLLRRPDRVESLQAFRLYVDALCRSLDQALAAPSIPERPAVDDHGVEWRNTTLSSFRFAMDAWLQDAGWTLHDRSEWATWGVLALEESDVTGDEPGLREYLEAVRTRAWNPALPEDWPWTPVAQALAAGRDRPTSARSR